MNTLTRKIDIYRIFIPEGYTHLCLERPVYQHWDPAKESFCEFAADADRNQRLVIIETNNGYRYKQVLGFDEAGRFVGFDVEGKSVSVWDERVIGWRELP